MRSWVQVLETASCINVGKGCVRMTKVVGPFPEPCTSGSYVHRAALYCCLVYDATFLLFLNVSSDLLIYFKIRGIQLV
jgi:hypothetical protein